MSTNGELEIWLNAETCAKSNEIPMAIATFSKIGKYAKVYFNIAMLQLRMNDWQAAKLSLKESTLLDPFLAVAFFQRGFICYEKQQYATALIDFNQTYEVTRRINFLADAIKCFHRLCSFGIKL